MSSARPGGPVTWVAAPGGGGAPESVPLRLRHVGWGVYLCGPSAAERAARAAPPALAAPPTPTRHETSVRLDRSPSDGREPSLDLTVVGADVAYGGGPDGDATVFAFSATAAEPGGAVSRNATVRLVAVGTGECVATKTAPFGDAMATAALSGVEQLFEVAVGLTGVGSSRDHGAFVVRPVPPLESAELLAALSARQPLRALAMELAAGRTPEPRALVAATGVLADLIGFIVGAPAAAEAGGGGGGGGDVGGGGVDVGGPRTSRQRVLREQGLLDACADIVRTLFDGPFDLPSLRVPSPAAGLARHAYRLLALGVRGNARNAAYAAKWLPLIMGQSCRTSGANDLGAGEALAAMFNANRRILDEKITPDIIEARAHSLTDGLTH